MLSPNAWMRSTVLAAATVSLAALAPTQETGGLSATPLAPREAGTDRFVRHDPAESGLGFVNELRPENVLPYVYNGAGVATGDFDGDGRPDVFLVSQDGADRLFRQMAPWRFEDVTEQAGVGGGDAWGTGASFVDFDGDGDLDLYVSNTESPNRLWQNEGDGTFRDVAPEVGLDHVGASTMPAFADYDNDGDLDLFLVTNRVIGPDVFRPLLAKMTLPESLQRTMDEMAPRIPPLERDDDGRWIIPEGLDDHLIPLMGRVFYGGQRDRLFRNDGARFTDVTEAAGITDHGMGLSATWWDYDDDGWLDLYVANDLESPDVLWHNRGDGTFENVTERALPHLAYFGMGSDFADVDQDGRFDLVVADMAMRTHYKSKMLMGDMGDRGWFLQFGRPPQIMRNALFLNTGTGRFLEAGLMAGVAKTDWTWAVKFADLDGDGWEDLFVTNGVPRFDNDPDLNPRFRKLWREGRLREAIDLAANVPPVKERNLALVNGGTTPGTPPRFTDKAADWGLDLMSVSQGAAFADFDGDGDVDIVVNNQNEPAALYENRVGAEHGRIVVRLVGRGANRDGLGARLSARAGDLRMERLVTLPGGYLSADEPRTFFGLGAAERLDRLEVRWPSGAVQVFEDLAADHLYTITEPAVVTERAAQAATQVAGPAPRFAEAAAPLGLAFEHDETFFDDFAVQPLLPHQHSQLGPGLATGDVDGDGVAEIWVGGAAGQSGALFQRDGERWRAVTGPWAEDAASEDTGATFADFDGDGDLDLWVVSGSVEFGAGRPELRDRLYLNEGDGTFTHAADALPRFADCGSAVTAADIDGDGDLDVFVGARVVPGRYPESPISRLYRNDGGTFTDVTEERAPGLRLAGLVTDATFADIDADGDPDLVVTAHWQPVRVWRNDGGSFTEATAELGFAARPGWWNGVAVGDVDGDGRADLVTTNQGWNTKYSASPKKPARLYAKDFDADGTLDVVEAKFEDGTLLPVRGRSCSSNAMPFLADKFPTYDQFARASLDEIYGDRGLDDATAFEVTELASTLWLQQADGTFAPRPLPDLAQIAPAFGAVIADLDGDGRQDVVLAQNFFRAEPETGRMAGGLSLWLRGTEDGLVPVPAAESGIVVPEDAVDVAVVDVDGDDLPDLVISTNDGPLRVFKARN